MRGTSDESSYDDLRRILSDIRKQYDEVHCLAEHCDSELVEMRRVNRILDLEAEEQPETLAYSSLTREKVQEQDDAIVAEIQHTGETKKVYKHMVACLQRELKIVQEKIKLMEGHLKRKTHDVEKRQGLSRRVHKEKVSSLNVMDDMEEEVELERMVCSAALEDLDMTLQQRKSEVRHREDFERWRYEVAMEAATEAFQSTAGRFRKIYAIEKLTGSCLQKIIMEQAEQNQTTEDGFQKIREVTGLTDVMDIVHKFLNRNVEHEQLKTYVKEAELRLSNLREAEDNRKSDASALDLSAKQGQLPSCLAAELAKKELELTRAAQQQEELQNDLKRNILLLESIEQWAGRINKSFAAFGSFDPIDTFADVVPYFGTLMHMVDGFMTHVSAELPVGKLAKLTTHATGKKDVEQQKLLTDKDFIRSNCRVPATLDPRPGATAQKNAENEQDTEVRQERSRLKQEARSKATMIVNQTRVSERMEQGGLHDKGSGTGERVDARAESRGAAGSGGPGERPASSGPRRSVFNRQGHEE